MDKKATIHSLRHNMKDLLRLCEAPHNIQNGILGHTVGGIGESYGSDQALLEVYKKWLDKALLNRGETAD